MTLAIDITVGCGLSNKVHHEFLPKRLITLKGSLQWKNDLDLYITLVLVMKIGICDLMIFRLV